jgi:hypothetical protein
VQEGYACMRRLCVSRCKAGSVGGGCQDGCQRFRILIAHRMTWTCALMTRVLLTVKPSSTLLSSMNFFQPQSCSFLQKRCSVSAQVAQSASQRCWAG